MGNSQKESEQPQADIVNLLDPAFRKGLEKAIKEQSFELFLESIDLIVESPIQDESAKTAWIDMHPVESPAKIPGIFLRWLARLSFDAPSENDLGLASQSNTEEMEISEPFEAGRKAGELAASLSAKANEFMNVPESKAFAGFYGVFPLLGFINEPYAAPLADASSVIAEHVRHMINEPDSQRIKYLHVRQRWLKNFILDDLISWVTAQAEAAEQLGEEVNFFDVESAKSWRFIPDLLSGAIDLSEPTSLPDGFETAILPCLMLTVPQQLFDRLATLAPYELPQFENYDEETPYLDLFDILTALPVTGERMTLKKFKDSISENSILHTFLERCRYEWQIPRVDPGIVANTLFNYSVSWPSIRELAEGGISEMGNAALTPHRLERRIDELNCRIQSLRRVHGGQLPMEMLEVVYLACGLRGISDRHVDEIDWDLALLLVSDVDPLMIIGYESGIGSSVLPIRGEHESPEMLTLRSALFGQAIDKARSEGLFDLSDALLGFYLVTQVLCDPNRDSIDWAVAGSALHDAYVFRNKGLVPDCVNLAYELTETPHGCKSFDRSKLNYFRQLAPSEPVGIDVLGLMSLVHSDRLQKAQRSLAEELPDDTLDSLPAWLRNALLEAENDYLHRVSREEAEHNSVNFSPAVIGYFSPVEKVLLQTLRFVSDHPSLESAVGFRISTKHIAIARVIGLLQNVESLPDDLKRHMRAKGCRFGSADEYSLDWLNNFKGIRNRAAHGGTVSRKEIEIVRLTLFDQGIRCLLKGAPPEALHANGTTPHTS